MTYTTYWVLIGAVLVLWLVVFAVSVVLWIRVWRLLQAYKRTYRTTREQATP